MNKETIDALSELAKAAARSQGWNENNFVFSACVPQERDCSHVWKKRKKYVEENETVRAFRICKKCGFEKEVNGINCHSIDD